MNLVAKRFRSKASRPPVCPLAISYDNESENFGFYPSASLWHSLRRGRGLLGKSQISLARHLGTFWLRLRRTVDSPGKELADDGRILRVEGVHPLGIEKRWGSLCFRTSLFPEQLQEILAHVLEALRYLIRRTLFLLGLLFLTQLHSLSCGLDGREARILVS